MSRQEINNIEFFEITRKWFTRWNVFGIKLCHLKWHFFRVFHTTFTKLILSIFSFGWIQDPDLNRKRKRVKIRNRNDSRRENICRIKTILHIATILDIKTRMRRKQWSMQNSEQKIMIQKKGRQFLYKKIYGRIGYFQEKLEWVAHFPKK